MTENQFKNQENKTKGAHRLSISGRHTGTITGVTDVRSFDECEIVLETEQGVLTVKGRELHISRLTLEQGETDIDGKIDSLVYSDGAGKKKGSVLERMFR